MLFQFTPFADHEGADHMVICKNIVRCVITTPSNSDVKAVSVIKKLLQRDPHKRLGCGKGGCKDIKNHPFFGALAFCLFVCLFLGGGRGRSRDEE